VVLVEKSGALGGWAAKLHKRVPTHASRTRRRKTMAWPTWSRIEADSNIKVYLNATIAKTDGAPGRFKVEIATESGASRTEDIGAIIQATGFTLYDANKLPELRLRQDAERGRPGRSWKRWRRPPRRASRSSRPSDGKPVKSVVFVQCAGQRDTTGTHLQYCSGFCCNTSIKQAMYFKDSNPDIDTTVLFTDLRTPGNGEDFYRAAQEKGVIFSKGVVSQVTPNGNTCTVKFKDLILGEDDRSAWSIWWCWRPAWCRCPASTSTRRLRL
jgi:quinone-modifying oxidoreductase, subunit QmoB